MLQIARRLNAVLSRLLGLRAAPALLVTVLVLAAFLPAFTTLPPVDRDEARFAQATKQMMVSGDYVDIRFQDRTRYKKPVGIYWAQAAAVAAVGHPGDRTIWHYRLPSLIAAVLAAVLTLRLATLFGGAAAGLAAGGLMAGIFMLGAEAHLAKTDAVLLAATVAVQLALARLYRDARAAGFRTEEIGPLGWGRFALFWGALAVAALVKGPIGPGIVALTVLLLALGHRRVGWLRALRPGWGLGLLVLLVAPWFVAITLKAGMGFWDEALGRDLMNKLAGAQESHGAPPGSYLAMLWITFQPAAVALLLALPALWRARRSSGVIFAAAWVVPGWIGFEAAPTKLMHYVLPFYPALALAIGLVWAETVAAAPKLWRRIGFWALGALPVLVLLAAGGYAISQGAWNALPFSLIALVLAGAGLLLAATALRAQLPHAAILGLWLLGAGFLSGLFPVAARLPALWPARQITALIPPDPACGQITLYATGYEEPSLVFLAPGPVKWATPDAAAQALGTDRCTAAVVPSADAAPLSAAGAVERGRVNGINLGTGKPVALAVFGPANK
ncbi:ArnT family glycosyltransferase [Acidimangrovimonas pyrenivorans]|uniref:ArnT family glycosyltransferase n=1 Tax=Acidimangrovimonas pyrenivorans TaxID=2030798 RepID=A0ABV7AHH9_9RHOB